MHPISSVIPVAFVLLLTTFKQVFEDIFRHRADWKMNSRTIQVLRSTSFQLVKWKDIRCGDIVCVECDTELPCDMLLLHAESADTFICHIQTSNLDGETTLKVRSVPHRFPSIQPRRQSHQIQSNEPQAVDDHADLVNRLIGTVGVITCEKPNNRLYEFRGKMITDQS